MTAFAPSGPAALDDSVVVDFSADVAQAAAATAGTEGDQPNLVAFTPSLSGVFIWESPRRLRFIPRGGLRPCTEYSARVSDTIRSVSGAPLKGQSEFTFRTAALTLIAAEQVGYWPGRRAVVQLKFNDGVMPSDLYKHLSIRAGGREVKWTTQGDARTKEPRIVTEPLPTTGSLSLRLEPGLKGVSGPRALEGAVDRLVPLTFQLKAQSLTANWTGERPHLDIQFSAWLQSGDWKPFISVEPPVDFTVSDDGNTLSLYGPFQPKTRYTVTVRKGIVAGNGHMLLEDATLSAWMPPIKPFAQFKDAGGHLSPQGRMKLRVRHAAIDAVEIRAVRVFDNNLALFTINEQSEWQVSRLGRETARREIPVTANPDEAAVTEIDLRDLLGAKPAGVYLFSLQGIAPAGVADMDDWRVRQSLRDSALVTVSNLGIIGKRGPQELGVWVAALDTAAPIPGAKVFVWSAKHQPLAEGETGPDGFALFQNLSNDPSSRPSAVVVRAGDDICHLDLEKSLTGAEEFPADGRPFLAQGYEAFLTADRGAYRPGERIHVFGYVRGKGGTVPPEAFPLEYQVQRPDGRRWEPRTVMTAPNGRVELELVVPNRAPTGLYRVTLQLPGTAQRRDKAARGRGSDDFEYDDGEDGAREAAVEELGSTEVFVEEFIPSRLKLTAEAAEKRFSVLEPLNILVKAEEMFGQPAAGRSVSGVVTYAPAPFKPEEFADYTFGDDSIKFTRAETELAEQTLDESGRARFEVSLPDAKAPAALRATVQITVKDTGGRGVTAAIERFVDPVPFYIGARLRAETFSTAGKPTEFDIVGVRSDLSPAGDQPLTGTISRVRFNSILKREDGAVRFETVRELSPVKQVEVALREGRATLTWTPDEAGMYLLELSGASGATRTAFAFHATSDQWTEQPWSLEKPERLEVVPDRALYQPGDTARLLVKAPFTGTLLITFEQDNILSHSVVQMSENTAELTLPVTDAMLPNVYASATVLRPVKPAEKWLPHRAFGFANITITPETRRLDVALSAPAEVRPLSGFSAEVLLRDATTSAPAAGEVTLWAVDEGVLALTAFETPSPLRFFHGVRRLAVATADFLSDLMPDVTETAGTKSASGGDAAGDSARRLSPVPAERVKPVAIYLGAMQTDSDGRASAEFALPQFFGRMRVMAVAAAGAKFGSADATVFVRGPLMIKESLPRFLAPGDTAETPLVVYNNTDTTQTVALTVETSGPLTAETGAQTSVEVPARGQVVHRVKLAAARTAGLAGMRLAGRMGTEEYSETIELPVRPASPSVRKAGVETIEPGAPRTITLPGGDFLAGTTTVSLAVSGLPALQFAGGLRYNIEYPYGCAEQIVSGAFPLLYLADLAAQVDPGRFSADGVRAAVQQAIDAVLALQTSSGGLAMWPGQREPWVWGSAYGAHFLIEARKAGFEVPDGARAELLAYLASQLAMPEPEKPGPWLTERAYICHVLALAGRAPSEAMDKLYERRSNLGMAAGALLAAAYAASGRAAEAQAILQPLADAADGDRATRRASGGTLDSAVRNRALLLAALCDAEPSSPAIAPLADWLLRARAGDRWASTQENGFALYALGRYAKLQAATPANFRGKVTVDGQTREFASDKPLNWSAADWAGKEVVIEIEGTGRAYAAWSVEGVPARPDSSPVDSGLSVTRRFVTRSGDTLNPLKLSQGQFVIVELALSGASDLENVVIEDLLPAGLEIENSNFATAEKIADGEAEEVPGLTIQHVEMRDDRMLGFVNLRPVADGETRVFRYAARAVNPGRYTLPPAQVQAMYDPGYSGRTGAGEMIVVGR
ncbi:MAG: alpha-2-macroglobulin family protein [Candidatus Sumerlaeaceae bacterium]|nr:alpha-2-macroglobulin family protein [Candidatus Sumerlaeaceae bacterium]